MSVRRDRNKPTRRKRCIFGLIGLVAVFAGVSVGSHFYYAPEPAISAEAVARKVTPQALHNDLDALVETAERIHPDLYFRVPKDSIAAFKRELKDQIDRPMTRKEFYPFAARLAARFGDGHTAVFPPREEILLAIEAGELWFPFSVADFDGRGFVVGTVYAADSPIAAGDSIVAIDGHNAKDLFDEFLQWQSGEKEFYRRGRALRATRWNLWIKGMGSPYRLRWQSARTGETSETTIRGVTDERIWEVESRLSRSEKNFSFRRLEGNIGYLEFRRMKDYSAFESFLAETFQDIHQEPIVGLIVDLRRNAGGSTSLGDLLLSYITNKPYRMIARMELKVSPWKKRALKERLPRWARWIPVQYLFREGRRIWRAAEGDIVAMELPVKAPNENPLRYRGPVCVLIGEVTFSSAQKLANAIKDYKLATLIGTETGGNPNAFGEMCIVRLPTSRLTYGVSGKRYVRANGDATWRRGILPDIEVQITERDRARGIDTVLEYAKRWIREQAESRGGHGLSREDGGGIE